MACVSELHDLTALEQGELVRRREVSPLELVEHYLDAPPVDDDPSTTVGAFVTLTDELARDRAPASSRPSERGAELAAVRRTDRDQGPQPDGRASARRSARRSSPTSCRTSPTAVTLALEAAGHGQPRQDRDAGVRLALLHRARGPAALGHARGTGPGWRAARPAARPRRWPPDWCRWPRARTVAAPSGSRPRAAGCSASSPRAGGSVVTPCTATRWVWRRPGRSPGPCATRRRCSTCSPVVGWGIRPGHHLLVGTFLAACDRDPGRLRIARFTDTSDRRHRCGPRPAWTLLWTLRGCWSRSATRSWTSPVPLPPEAVPVFETCWAVLTALSVVPPEQEHLLRPLTRWLTERGRAVSGPEFGLAIGEMRRFAAGALTALAPYDAVLTPTLAVAAAAGRRDPRRRRPGRRLRGAEAVHAVDLAPGTSPACRPSRCRSHWTDDGLPVGVMLAARPGRGGAAALPCAPRSRRPRPGSDRHPPGW